MASRALETEIDRLYQLPLDQFTAARNALAKTAGTDAARVRALTKPPVAAWAVNQLYWRNGDVWNALIEAAENARRAHKAVLSGRSGDVRAASRVHDEAVDTALKATLALVADGGHPVTDATKQAIVTTLRALPADDPAGRLTRVLQPGGFEALAGLPIARGAGLAKPAKPAKTAPSRPAPEPETPTRPKVDAKALTRARQAVAAAARAVREAETAVRREQFEVARAKREEERAADAVEKAGEAARRAAAELTEAETAAADATKTREAATKRARDAEQALEKAQAEATQAAAALKHVEHGTR